MSVTLVIAFESSFMLAHSANASALFFEKTAVRTNSETTCLSFASDVARNQNFKNVHKSHNEVAGEKDGAYVAITCVGRGQQPTIAIVMSVSDSFDTAKKVDHSVADRMKALMTDSVCQVKYRSGHLNML
ncbi:MAG: hypothetical protein ABFD50_05435 [Smithella sp.]